MHGKNILSSLRSAFDVARRFRTLYGPNSDVVTCLQDAGKWEIRGALADVAAFHHSTGLALNAIGVFDQSAMSLQDCLRVCKKADQVKLPKAQAQIKNEIRTYAMELMAKNNVRSHLLHCLIQEHLEGLLRKGQFAALRLSAR